MVIIMKIRFFSAILFLMLLFSSCGGAADASVKIEEPMTPMMLYEQIAQTSGLPAMITLTAEELYDVIGIDPAWYSESAAYFASDGTAPDEILIFLAVDESAADALEGVLYTRLQYKQDSAEQYLTENQPMLENGVVRRDGLMVSLLVCADMDTAEKVYQP